VHWSDAAAIGVSGPWRRQMKKLPKEEEGLYGKNITQNRGSYVKYYIYIFHKTP
jgi:hypothetical protein